MKNTEKFKSIVVVTGAGIVSIVIVMITLLFFFSNSIVQAFKFPSGSMKNTILAGDFVLVNNLHYKYVQPIHGDIIVFDFPKDPSKIFIKRVVAVAGDTIEIRNKKVFINGSLKESNFVIHSDENIFSDPAIYPANFIRRDNFAPTKIPDGQLFVMGDNRDESNDSRFWGFVDVTTVHGKVFIIYWSWDKVENSIRWHRIGERL